MLSRYSRICAFTLILGSTQLLAKVQLPAVFSDHMVMQRNAPVRVWGWASSGERVRVRLGEQEHLTVAQNSQWEITLEPLPAGGPHTLQVDGFNRIEINDILFGEVWLASGQSNMNMTVKGTSHAEESLKKAIDPRLRLFQSGRNYADVPLPDVEGKWVLANEETAESFSAVAFLFGVELLQTQNVPIGLIQSSVGGTRVVNWTSERILSRNPDARNHYDYYQEQLREYPAKLDAWRTQKENGGENVNPPTPPDRRQPNGYFNGMIHGLIPYRLRGVIWYQGETDTWNAEEYTRMFPEMISDWRERWGQGNFPFLYVQLPGFNGKPGVDVNYPFLREIQRLTENRLPNLAMAVTIDQGEEDDIHPRDKRQVAHRLALLARNEVYGEDVIAQGPQPIATQIEGDRAEVRWTGVAEGLKVHGDTLRGFSLAGDDGVFHPAEATIEDDTTTVWSPEVAAPVYLRYSFRGFPDGNLYNSAGLPAVPFRTDDFPRDGEAVKTVPDR